VFILLLTAPSNPQTYNPQTFLFSVLFLLIAAGLLFAAESLIPPVSLDRRLRWLLASVCAELRSLPSRQKLHFAPEEAMFRDASRISQVLAASGDMPAAVTEAVASFDLAAALRLCEAELNDLIRGPLENEARAACAALAARDFQAVKASTHALKEAAALQDITVDGAVAALGLALAEFGTPSPATRISA
jgi:hypothetical protein